MIDVIDRIAYFRKQSGLTQKALSLAVGLNSGYINRLEAQRNFLPSLEVLAKILDVLKVKAEEFFAEDLDKYYAEQHLLRSLQFLLK